RAGGRRKRSASGREKRSQLDETGEEGGPDEAVAFIAETVTELVKLAERHRLEVLSHLLGMAKLEAEERLRLRSKRKLSCGAPSRRMGRAKRNPSASEQAARMMGFAALYPSYDSVEPRTVVVPAKAGTHNHREGLWREQAVAAEHITSPCGYGSRVKPGTT